MTPERTALTLADLVQLVQFILCAVPANPKRGTGDTAFALGLSQTRTQAAAWPARLAVRLQQLYHIGMDRRR